MAAPISRGPVDGTWVRHVHLGTGGLETSPESNGRFHHVGQRAIYLADTEQTAWAEWYRSLAEWSALPADQLPRELYRISVQLQDVVDLRSAVKRKAVGAPERMQPTSRQWPAFQALAERLMAEGIQGVVYRSAARTRSSCLCVFEAGFSGLSIVGDPALVQTPPAPPRGLRT